MPEIILNEIERYVTDRLVGVEADVISGKEFANDHFYARFWEGRQVADVKHKETLIKILEIINRGKKK